MDTRNLLLFTCVGREGKVLTSRQSELRSVFKLDAPTKEYDLRTSLHHPLLVPIEDDGDLNGFAFNCNYKMDH